MKFGDEAEIILEELLQRGYGTASETLIKVQAKLLKDEKIVQYATLIEKFQSLVIAKYLKRIPKSPEEKPVPILNVDEKQQFILPPLDTVQLVAVQKGSNEELMDAGIYWTVNFDRFHQDMRDKIIFNAVSKKFDENYGELIRIFLQQMYIRTEPWVDISNPIPVMEVRDIIKKANTHPLLTVYMDQYVNILGK